MYSYFFRIDGFSTSFSEQLLIYKHPSEIAVHAVWYFVISTKEMTLKYFYEFL